MISRQDFQQAQKKVNEILFVDKKDSKAKSLLTEVERLGQQQKKERQDQENRVKCEKTFVVANKLFDEDKIK